MTDRRWLAGMTALKVRQIHHEEQGLGRNQARDEAMRERTGRSPEWIEIELRCLQVINALARMRILSID